LIEKTPGKSKHILKGGPAELGLQKNKLKLNPRDEETMYFAGAKGRL